MKSIIKSLIAFFGASTFNVEKISDSKKGKVAVLEQREIQNQPLETIIQNNSVKSGINPKNNYKTLDSSDYIFIAKPIEAGQSTELVVMEKLIRESSDSVEKIVLLEDGNEIFTTNEKYLIHEVVQTKQGSHNYAAELHKKSGMKIETNDIKIAFTGKIIDFPPYIQLFFSTTQEAGKATNILVQGEDIGDNKGIKRITLYEDGKPLETINRNGLMKTIQYDSPQTHIYHAEIEDKGSQIATTKKITVTYSGEAFQPSVSCFFASPEDAGRTTQILVQGKDDKNYDDLKGIDRIVLYEDGQQIHEKNGEGFLFEVTHNESGNHQYHAEIYNGNGKVLKTKPLTVSFKGQDFPPEVSWWYINYKPEEGFATVLVEGKDKKNVRDDAGISQIVLFEDGKPIETVEKASLLTELTRQPGSHTYFAQITNNSGLTTKTKEIAIDYQAK